MNQRTTPTEIEEPAQSNAGSGLVVGLAMFRLLIESIEDYAIFMLNPQGRVASWNAGAQRIKGYRASEIIGKHFSRFYLDEDVASGRCERDLASAARDGRFEDERWSVRKDGSRFWANVVITPLRDEAGTLLGFAKVTRDLTARRAAEQERIELERMQEASRLKDQFLATISHELRTPLNAIFGWASLLRTASDSATVEKAAETILRNAQAQIIIVDDMLDMSRIVTGKMRIEVRTVDFSEIVRDAVEVVRPGADAKNIELRLEGLDREVMVAGDAVRLQQITWNFLSNAVKFTSPEGVVTVSLVRKGSSVELRVQDTGRGIDRAFLPYVFEPFRQAETGPARRVGGVGLGLAIVKHIVELHGGSVSVSSDGLGLGTTFSATLPIRVVTPPMEGVRRVSPVPRELEPAGPAMSLEGVRVLVVDDDPDARDILKTLFEKRGGSVYAASSAGEGREALASFAPDIIVSDIGMPGEDGYKFMQSVRALPKEEGGATPAVALTAYAYQEDRRRALAAGFNYHLAKPVSHEDLLQAVHNSITFIGGQRRKK